MGPHPWWMWARLLPSSRTTSDPSRRDCSFLPGVSLLMLAISVGAVFQVGRKRQIRQSVHHVRSSGVVGSQNCGWGEDFLQAQPIHFGPNLRTGCMEKIYKSIYRFCDNE